MFRGEAPVPKTIEGRYFLEADASAFQAILKFLTYDELPAFNSNEGNSGSEITSLYQTATMYDLKRLVQHLEHQCPILFKRKLEAFCKSRVGYDECLTKVVEAINHGYFRMKGQLAVRITEAFCALKQKCCAYNCVFSAPPQVDVETITVPCEVDEHLLRALYYTLQDRAFNVQPQEFSCSFQCSKQRETLFCCSQKMYILNVITDNNVIQKPILEEHKTENCVQTSMSALGSEVNYEQSSVFGSSIQSQPLGASFQQLRDASSPAKYEGEKLCCNAPSTESDSVGNLSSLNLSVLGKEISKENTSSQEHFESLDVRYTHYTDPIQAHIQPGNFTFDQQAAVHAESSVVQTQKDSSTDSADCKRPTGHTFGGDPNFQSGPISAPIPEAAENIFGARFAPDVLDFKLEPSSTSNKS